MEHDARKALLRLDWTVITRRTYGEGNQCADRFKNQSLMLPLGVHKLIQYSAKLCPLLYSDIVWISIF